MMRKVFIAALVLACVVLVGTTVATHSNYKKAVAQEEDTRLRYDRAVGEIVSIQDSLSAMVLGNDGTMGAMASPDLETHTPQTLHDQGLARIAMLKSQIERTKNRIEELDASLKKSGVKIENLEKMIAGLRHSVKDKEQRIAELSTQVDGLQTQVAGLTTQVDEKQHELATIYYMMGTKKELTDTGVVEAKGGVLGIGKTLKPSGLFNEASFTPLDTDQENVIRIPAPKAQVLSAQPATSYVLQPVDPQTVELRILNAEEFRKIRHLVILTMT